MRRPPVCGIQHANTVQTELCRSVAIRLEGMGTTDRSPIWLKAQDFWGLRLKRPFLIDQQRFDGIRVVGLQKVFFIISPLRVLALPPPSDGDPYRQCTY